MRILALDIGQKRIGLAISDELGMFAHPLDTLIFFNIDDLIENLKSIITSKNITELVVGIPYALKGTKSKKTEEVLQIKQELNANLSIPIHEIDERLTTKLAERTLHNLGKKPSKNRHIIDQIAATEILQTYLDRENRSIK
jgi:putative Holliday junction resolvase